MGRFEQWPHALGELAVNPLYMTGPSNDAGTVYLRRYPLDAYTNINPQVKSYLPELFRLTKPQAGLIHHTKDEIGYAKDRLAAKPMITFENDDLIAIASEEVSLNRLFPGRALDTREPPPGSFGTWSRSI